MITFVPILQECVYALYEYICVFSKNVCKLYKCVCKFEEFIFTFYRCVYKMYECVCIFTKKLKCSILVHISTKAT